MRHALCRNPKWFFWCLQGTDWVLIFWLLLQKLLFTGAIFFLEKSSEYVRPKLYLSYSEIAFWIDREGEDRVIVKLIVVLNIFWPALHLMCIFVLLHWLIAILESYRFGIRNFYSSCVRLLMDVDVSESEKKTLIVHWFKLSWIKSQKFWNPYVVVESNFETMLKSWFNYYFLFSEKWLHFCLLFDQLYLVFCLCCVIARTFNSSLINTHGVFFFVCSKLSLDIRIRVMGAKIKSFRIFNF